MAWAPDYATGLDLMEYTRIPDMDDDAQILLALSAASRAIDRHCRRQFGKVDAPVERVYRASSTAWSLSIADLMDDTGIAVTVGGDALTGFTLAPLNAPADGRPWTRLEGTTTAYGSTTVSVTALWGWAAVPDAVRQACLLQASRFLSRRDAPFGIAGSPDTGSEMRLLAKVDPDVAVTLEPYRRKARAQ